MVQGKAVWCNVKLRLTVLAVGLAMLCLPGSLQSQSINVLDGHFCETSEWGTPVGIDNCDVGTGGVRCPGEDQEHPGPPGTSDLEKLWIQQRGDTLYVAWGRVTGGAGTGSYNLRLDKDCNGFTNADVIVELKWGAIGTSNNCPNNPQSLEVYVNGTFYTYAYQGQRYCGDCGTGSWGHYAEFSILFTDLIYDPNLDIDIDPCDCSCGVIRLSEAGTYAGGSFNSQKKDGFDILDPSGDLEWRYNSCPEADFVATPDPVCEGYAIFF